MYKFVCQFGYIIESSMSDWNDNDRLNYVYLNSSKFDSILY